MKRITRKNKILSNPTIHLVHNNTNSNQLFFSNTSHSHSSSNSHPQDFNITIYKTQDGLYSITNPTSTTTTTFLSHKIPRQQDLPFKKKNWSSKIRLHEKSNRNSKNMKNLSKDIIDGISYKIYQELEAGPSVLPKKKYCDFSGLEAPYSEINTGIRFYNADIYKKFQKMPQPIKNQYLNIRRALI